MNQTIDTEITSPATAKMPGWVKGFIITAVVLIGSVIIMQIQGGGNHGPGRHEPDTANTDVATPDIATTAHQSPVDHG